MKPILFFCFFSLFAISLSAQNRNKTVEDSRLRQKILYGPVTLEAFEMPVCKNWYGSEYEAYTIHPGILKKLKKEKLEEITIQLVLGSWCHDTHREVPRLIKILDAMQFPFEQLYMTAVDSQKTAPGFDLKAHQVKRVPTAIVYRNQKEIGRIVETPKKNMEKDLFKIISGN